MTVKNYTKNPLHISPLLSETYAGECQVLVLGGSVPSGTLTSKTDAWCRQCRLKLEGDMQ